LTDGLMRPASYARLSGLLFRSEGLQREGTIPETVDKLRSSRGD